MQSYVHSTMEAGAAAAGLALALLTGVAPSGARAQQPMPSRPAAGPGWYGYVPGQGWVGYAPGSAPVARPGASSYRIAPPGPGGAAPPPPGWQGYSPGSAWEGYAPASAPRTPVVRTMPRRGAIPADGSRRRAANLVVNGNAPELLYTLPAYREYGTGRNVPLAKPWLPASP